MSIRSTRSSALFERARQIFPGGVNSPVRAFKSVGRDPFMVSHGEGAYIFDVDGNRYIDYVASWGPLVLGHAHPQVVQAISKQLVKGTTYGACCEQESRLGETIIKFMPKIEMLRFVNSGTEAGMSAIRLARAFTKRNKIIKFSGCYHGHVDALLVQAGSGVATLGLPDCEGISRTVTADTITAEFNDKASLESIFAEFPDSIAAVILEPIIGNAGFIKPADDYLRFVREITERHKSLLIMDEVMTGFRVHRGGAQELFGITPDLVMLGKVIGGGLPVGAFGGRRDIMSMLAPLGPVYQAGTLSGNPLAMVAGLETLNLWIQEGLFDRAAEATTNLCAGLSEAARQAGIPFTADSQGTMFGFFFQEGPVRNYTEAKKSDTRRFSEMFGRLLEQGIYFAPSQFEAGFVSALHDDQIIERTINAFTSALRA